MVKYIQLLYYLLFLSLPFSLKWKLGSSEITLPSEFLQILISTLLVTQYKQIYTILKKHFQPILTKIVLVFFLLGFISITYSDFPLVSLKFMIIESMHVVVFLIGFLYLYENNKNTIRQLTFLYSVSFVILLIRGWILHSNYQFAVSFSTAALLPFFQDNPMWGATSALLLPFWLSELFNHNFKHKNRFRLFVISLFSLFIAVGIITSYSRAVWLSLSISISFTIIVFIFHKSILKQLLVLLVFLMSITGLFYFLIVGEFASLHVKNQNPISQLFSSFNWKNDVSNMERLNRYKCAIRIFKDYPLMGTGINTYKRTYLNYQQKEDMTRISVENIEVKARYGTGGDCHSEYFTILSELGVFGIIIWLVLVAFVFFYLLKIYNESNKFHYSLFYFFSMSTFFLHVWVNNFMHEEKLSCFVWMIVGYIISYFSELESIE